MFGHTCLVLVREAKHPAAASHPLQVIGDVHHDDDAQVPKFKCGVWIIISENVEFEQLSPNHLIISVKL